MKETPRELVIQPRLGAMQLWIYARAIGMLSGIANPSGLPTFIHLFRDTGRYKLRDW